MNNGPRLWDKFAVHLCPHGHCHKRTMFWFFFAIFSMSGNTRCNTYDLCKLKVLFVKLQCACNQTNSLNIPNRGFTLLGGLGWTDIPESVGYLGYWINLWIYGLPSNFWTYSDIFEGFLLNSTAKPIWTVRNIDS